MAQPSKTPDWNTALTNNVEPLAGRKSSGFATNDIPTSGELNWWMNTVYQWCNYLKGLVAGTETWNKLVAVAATAGAAITGTGNGSGSGVVGTGGATNGIGVAGTGGGSAGTGVLGTGQGASAGVWGVGGASAGPGVFGQSNNGGQGGRFSGSGSASGVHSTGGPTNGWGVEGHGQGGGIGVYGEGGASAGQGVYGKAGSSSGVGVEAEGIGAGNGLYVFSGGGTAQSVAQFDGYLNLNGATVPAGTTGFAAGLITPKHTVKAYASMSLAGATAAGTSVLTANYALNIQSATMQAGYVEVTLANALSFPAIVPALSIVSGGAGAGAPLNVGHTIVSSTVIRFYLFEADGTTAINLTGADARVLRLVFHAAGY
jgi:hypothetical protein